MLKLSGILRHPNLGRAVLQNYEKVLGGSTVPSLQRLTAGNYQQQRYRSGISTPMNTIIMFVPQQEAWVVERMGKFHRVLDPGLNILLPVLDKVKYVNSLKEIAIDIPKQSAITQDNVTLTLDGVLYLVIVDPYKASYGVEDPEFAITQLAQTTMRSELGKITLDTIFRERESLNILIVESINKAAEAWGIACRRYEIRDIQLPPRVQEAMQMQVEAERKKRAQILESEGIRESEINKAEGQKRSRVLASEADQQEKINHAIGEATALLKKAEARAQSIDLIGKSLAAGSGQNAGSLIVAEQYVQAFQHLAKKSNTILLPADTANVTSMVTQAMTIYQNLSKNNPNVDFDPEEYYSDGDINHAGASSSIVGIMIKFFNDGAGQDFSNYILILPAVSVGNVGQLVTDLLITNLKTCKKVGRVYHSAVEPVVGNDISEDGQVSLMTSCEVFQDDENKLLIIQFHAPVFSKKSESFVEFLCNWIKGKQFRQVLCLSSTFASERIDSQLSGPPFRFLSSSSTSAAVNDLLARQGLKSLEGRQFPAPAVLNTVDNEGQVGETYLPGSGITKELLEKCEAEKIPIAVVLMFVSEGDNTHDANYFFSVICNVFEWRKSDLVRTPPSWIHLFGGSFPQEIY
ncbi:unnamed protein product [Allacma fusca]|uniref:Band 7 domain-containing protein n=1 Tax=Allacma fusca TaxID=39272 RepID=A0A8J2M8S9_9HEXA|nr:unnamed protein product [Allacma fusca]